MTSDVLKLFAKFGANGLIILMVWGLLALLTLLNKLPAEGGSNILIYKTFLQYSLVTITAITASFFLTWNLAGWPKRLGHAHL